MSDVAQSRRPAGGRGVVGLVLSGGRGTRVGGRDKGLVRHRGRPLVVEAVQALSGHCDLVLISANRNLTRYVRYADGVVSDTGPGFLGPLAGIRAGLRAVTAAMLVVVPCDVEGLDRQVPVRLVRALRLHGGADAAVVRDARRLQPLVAAVRGRLGPSLDRYLSQGGRSVTGWLGTLSVTEVTVPGVIGNRNVMPSARWPRG